MDTREIITAVRDALEAAQQAKGLHRRLLSKN